MRRDVYGEDHDLYREQFRRFAEKEIAPKIAAWNEAGMPDRETWRRLGEEGFLGASMPEEYGGAGGDFLFDAIVMEELAWLRAHALMFSLHIDICAPYIRDFGTEAHKEKYLRGAIEGRVLLGVAMTEPGTGSDLAAVQTRAIRDGDHYVVNGSKTFISHGQIGDVFIVVCKTDPDAKPPHRGMSLLLVEAGTPGFVKGRKLDKLGLPGQDTSELFFQDCRVPVSNLLGEEGQGFRMLMTELQQERLCIGVSSIASCRRALADTIDYVKGRRAFGQPIASFQNTQFKLAELATEVEIGPGLRRPPARRARARRRRRHRGEHGEVVDHRPAEASHRGVSAAPRRLRIHEGVRDRGRLRGCRRAVDLRRHQRDHEAHHRAADGARLSRGFLCGPSLRPRRSLASLRRGDPCDRERSGARGGRNDLPLATRMAAIAGAHRRLRAPLLAATRPAVALELGLSFATAIRVQTMSRRHFDPSVLGIDFCTRRASAGCAVPLRSAICANGCAGVCRKACARRLIQRAWDCPAASARVSRAAWSWSAGRSRLSRPGW